MADVTAVAPTTPAERTWYDVAADEVAAALGVDAEQGLSTAEAASRLAQYGPNKFAEAAPEPRWHAFVRQYSDPMQIVLLVAGVGSICPAQAVRHRRDAAPPDGVQRGPGLNQEGKAAAAVAALQKMMIIKAKVHRDGQLLELPAHELVPGDVVAIEAGDVVPADGRILQSATLEFAESALTGESVPVSKGVETVEGEDVPLGDRTDMVFMNTNCTRGTAHASSSPRPACRPRSATSPGCCRPRTTP